MTKIDRCEYVHKGWLVCRLDIAGYAIWPPDAPDGAHWDYRVSTLREAGEYISRRIAADPFA